MPINAHTQFECLHFARIGVEFRVIDAAAPIGTRDFRLIPISTRPQTTGMGRPFLSLDRHAYLRPLRLPLITLRWARDAAAGSFAGAAICGICFELHLLSKR
jgi:hypothetical protein